MHCAGALLSTLLALANPGSAVPTNPDHNGLIDNHLAVAQNRQPIMSMRQNVDNTCGNRNGQTFKCNSELPGGGPCCSQYGFCGTGPLYCGDGCQSDFGQCDLKIASHRPRHCGPKHKNSRCGAGECCSANGRCGRSKAFCGKHCQPDFGTCHHKDDPKPKPVPEPKPDAETHPKRCGKAFDNAKCTNGECCSADGYCGKGSEYCKVPQECQREFGICDSDAVPKGLDVTAMVQSRPRLGKVPYGQEIRKCTRPKTLALSFDDGPSNNTMRILDVLRDHKAKATFFISGNTNGKGMIDETAVWIAAIKRIIDEGHQIGSHTWSHPHLNAIPRSARLLDMARNDRAIANIVGQFPTYMRPPYVECSKESGCLQDMTDMGYHVFGWDVDSLDWRAETTLDQMRANANNALNERKADDSMFFIQHDHNRYAVELTKYVLEQAQKKQWQAVTLGECMDDPSDFWYHEPTWIDMSAIATSDSERGCVVAAPGFCGTMQPFKDKPACNHAISACKGLVRDCKKKLGKQNLACVKYDKICTHQKLHCEKCGGKGQPACESASWSFNRLNG